MRVVLFLLGALLATASGESIYDFNANTIDGNGVSLDKYRGKVVVILNVATN
jgi:glutathione peroxidase-family protein